MTTTVHEDVEVHHILTERAVDDLCDWLDSRERRTRLAFDIETHTREYREYPGDMNTEEWHPSSKITVLTLSPNGNEGFAIPLVHPAAPWYGHGHRMLARIVPHLDGLRLIAHNAKFDLRWILWHTGVDLTDSLHWDTMLAAHVLDETEPTFRLKNLASPLAPGGDWGNVDLTNTEQAEWTPISRYAVFDTAMTFRLYEQQYGFLKHDRELAKVFGLISMPIVRALTKAEHRGIEVDPERLEQEHASMDEMARENEAWLFDVADSLDISSEGRMRSLNPNAKFFREMMQRAIEVGLIEGLEHTPTGQWSWRKGVRSQLRDRYELAQHLDDYRFSTKRLEFLRVWDHMRDAENRLHPSTRVHGTRTGRLSSANPNMQQVARDLKRVFRVNVEMDYSQIELRVAAWVSRCRPMIEAFQQGRDLHTLMASIATGKPEDEVTKKERQQAKALNFGFIYGMGAEGFVTYARENYGVEVSYEEAEDLRAIFFNTWQGLEEWHRRYEWIAYEEGEVRSPLGRRRLLPNARSDDRGLQHEAFRQAINSPVQATASDIMLLSIVEIDKQFPSSLVRVIGTVHDSVLLEVDDLSLIPKIADVMMYPDLRPFGTSIDVPLVVDATVGTHWADEDANEETYTPCLT